MTSASACSMQLRTTCRWNTGWRYGRMGGGKKSGVRAIEGSQVGVEAAAHFFDSSELRAGVRIAEILRENEAVETFLEGASSHSPLLPSFTPYQPSISVISVPILAPGSDRAPRWRKRGCRSYPSPLTAARGSTHSKLLKNLRTSPVFHKEVPRLPRPPTSPALTHYSSLFSMAR